MGRPQHISTISLIELAGNWGKRHLYDELVLSFKKMDQKVLNKLVKIPMTTEYQKFKKKHHCKK